jgi:hypothetical protein
MNTLAALLVILVLAGCLVPTTKPTVPSPFGSAGPAQTVKALTGCASGCWEPAIAIDGHDRVFVVAAQEPKMAISLDRGRTFTQTQPPPVPSGAPAGAKQADGYVQVGPNGRLYYIAFLMQQFPASLGLQIASSADGAQTWDWNRFLPVDATQGLYPPWKSWLGFDPGGKIVYFLFNQRPTGVWMARSDDEGRTFGAFAKASMPGERIISAFPAAPVVDSQGRLFVAYFGDQTPQDPTGNPLVFKGHTLRVAISDDKGRTFRYVSAAHKDPPAWVGSFFPVLAIDEHDRLFIAYWNDRNQIQVVSSSDCGATWSPPAVWSGPANVPQGPWAKAKGGVLSVMYDESNSDGGALVFARAGTSDAPMAEPTDRGVLIVGAGTGGDFPHFDLTRDGRIAGLVVDKDHDITIVYGPQPTR